MLHVVDKKACSVSFRWVTIGNKRMILVQKGVNMKLHMCVASTVNNIVFLAIIVLSNWLHVGVRKVSYQWKVLTTINTLTNLHLFSPTEVIRN